MAHRLTMLLTCLLLCVGCVSPPVPSPSTRLERPVLGLPWTVPGLGMEMVFVEAGRFTMGSEDARDYAPVREMLITRPFWVASTPT